MNLPGAEEFGSRVRFGRLRLMARSPAHFFAHPEGVTSSMDKGKAVHSSVLGGQRVVFYEKPPSEYELAAESGRAVLVYEKQRRGKDWDAFAADHPEALIMSPSELEKAKASIGSERSSPRTGAAWMEFQARNAGALILSRTQYEDVSRIVESIQAHKDAMFLLGGEREKTILFDMMALECRTTPDARQAGFVTELKTCRSSDPRRFQFDSLRAFYHAQCAFHAEGARRAKLEAATPDAYIVAVETELPYPVTIFKLTPRALEQGMKSIRIWMEQLKGCLASNQWPAYAQSYVDLDVPDPDAGLVFATPEEDLPF